MLINLSCYNSLCGGEPLPIFFLFLFICLFGSYDDHLLTNGSSIFFCVFATFGFLSLPAWFNCSLLLLPPPTNQPTNPNYYYYYYHHLIPGVHLSVLVVCWYRYTIPGLVITYSKFLFFPFFTFVLGALLPFFSEHFVAEFFSFFL
jgi:hypothetical protein